MNIVIDIIIVVPYIHKIFNTNADSIVFPLYNAALNIISMTARLMGLFSLQENFYI